MLDRTRSKHSLMENQVVARPNEVSLDTYMISARH